MCKQVEEEALEFLSGRMDHARKLIGLMRAWNVTPRLEWERNISTMTICVRLTAEMEVTDELWMRSGLDD